MADQELQVKFGADMQEWNAAIAKAKADLSVLDGYLRKSAQAHNLSARATKTDAVEQTQLVAALNSLKRGLSETNAQLAKNSTSLKGNSDQARNSAKDYDQTGMSLANMAKGYLSVAAVMTGGRIFLESTKEVQKYENQLKVASGTQEDYAKNTQFLEGLASKYNKNVIDLGANFAKLTIATRGTNMEGAQTEKLFAAVTATSAALQMSVDDTNGTFNAFIQMVSKGCHGKGTLIRMFDGSAKLVEDIIPGDLLMGPDGLFREVILLAQGREQMYEVIPEYGNSFIVNHHHKLRLSDSTGNKHTIELKDYLISGDVFGLIHEKNSNVRFSIKPIGEDDFYGFLISGDHLYLDNQGFEHHNTVQAEELRGQLGERLYGAFNLAAKSMGVTTQELNKMLERGEVLAADLLPKLTVELENTFGKDAEEGARNLGSAIEYTKGQLTLLIAEAGKSTGLTNFFSKAAEDAGGLLAQLRLINKEQGLTGVVLGLMDSGAETLLNGTGFEGATLKRARQKQKDDSYAPLLGRNLRLPGEIQPASNGQFPFAQNFSVPVVDDTNNAAAERLKKANDAKARKAEAAVNKWVSEQIQASKDRIAEAFAEIERQNQPDYKRHGVISNTAIGQAQPRGIDEGFANLTDDKMTKSFSSDVSSTAVAMEKLGHVMEQMNAIDPLDWKNTINAEGLRAQNSALAEQSLILEESADRLNEAATGSLRNAAASTMEGIGAITAGIITGTADLADIGDAFLGIMATLFENIGQALAAHAATLLIAKIMIGSNNIAGVAAGAVMAFAAAAVVKSQIAESGSQAFWTGGVVQGQGVDRVPAMLTPGEMILTQSHQSNLMSFLDGAHSASSFGGAAGDYGDKQIRVHVTGDIRNDRIALSNKDGEKRNRYFT